ncbi:PTS system fructose IIA component, putative [beta proteobacterium KB13]|uniref:PTS system fructose IIA component, putative n=1 Tax=beta proteobacterium KB13 TaxID=314607 RepID=B6BVF4_9PROT|nr:PTS system fructose IIA component, putative [beta proteobacterium KB13]
MFRFLLITHGNLGQSLVECVENNLQKKCCDIIDIISLNSSDIDLTRKELDIYVNKNKDCEIIILTDLYGASSSNIVKKHTSQENIYAISGLNLPMLMKAVTLKTNDIQIMVDEIIKCGNKSIINFL